jgi:hypothetical protein
VSRAVAASNVDPRCVVEDGPCAVDDWLTEPRRKRGQTWAIPRRHSTRRMWRFAGRNTSKQTNLQLLAMQKVAGSSPISRFREVPATKRFSAPSSPLRALGWEAFFSASDTPTPLTGRSSAATCAGHRSDVTCRARTSDSSSECPALALSQHATGAAKRSDMCSLCSEIKDRSELVRRRGIDPEPVGVSSDPLLAVHRGSLRRSSSATPRSASHRARRAAQRPGVVAGIARRR